MYIYIYIYIIRRIIKINEYVGISKLKKHHPYIESTNQVHTRLLGTLLLPASTLISSPRINFAPFFKFVL